MAKHRAHGRHRAPTPTRVVVARIVGGTLAAGFALSLIVPTADAAPTPDVQSKASSYVQHITGWAAEGYDGTDASLAQYAYDHGQLIEGYGVDVSKVYDTSKPYGWKANPDTGEWEYVGYCGDATLAEGEGEPEVDRATGKRCAAEMILLRMRGGGGTGEDTTCIYEDWTWTGMPPVVAEFHDALIDDFKAAHGGAYSAPDDLVNGSVVRFLSRVALVDSAF